MPRITVSVIRPASPGGKPSASADAAAPLVQWPLIGRAALKNPRSSTAPTRAACVADGREGNGAFNHVAAAVRQIRAAGILSACCATSHGLPAGRHGNAVRLEPRGHGNSIMIWPNCRRRRFKASHQPFAPPGARSAASRSNWRRGPARTAVVRHSAHRPSRRGAHRSPRRPCRARP
jgi:hypothetical protein